MAVPELPADPSGYVMALEQHRFFQPLTLSAEDMQRTGYYRADGERKFLSTILELQEYSARSSATTRSCWLRTTTAADIDGWDSMMHINLIIALEKRFGVRFAAAEISKIQGRRSEHRHADRDARGEVPPTSASRP